MHNKKIIAGILIVLFLGSTFVSGTNCTIEKNIKIEVQKNEQQLSFSNMLDSIMEIPEYYYDLSKAPSYYKVGDKLVAEEFNFGIGTFGNNYISYGPHGIDRIALYNNYYDALGGTYGTKADNPQCLNGTFLGVFMNNSGKKVSRILQEFPPTDRKAKDYGLQPVEKMDCYSNIPIGYYQYHDQEFSAEIGLNVFSPVILYDVKNSSMPVSIWNFNTYNPTNETVEVSFLFSLENDIGWRRKEEVKSNNKDVETTSYEYIWQRTGTYNYIQENKDMIGVKFTYDENLMSKSHPEYLGNMTLATIKQPNVTISYISEWDTLGDGNDLLSSFTTSGLLSNQNDSKRAKEEEHIYAGALSAKVVLKPGEGKNIPFVLATCFPIFNLSNITGMKPIQYYDWFWTRYFNDSWSIANYSLNNYENWWTSINDWHEKLYNSGLPPEIMMFMLGSLSPVVSNTFFSRQGYWFTAHTGLGYPEIMTTRHIDWFLGMFYPEIIKFRIRNLCIAVDYHDGFCPFHLWYDNGVLHQEPAFIIRAYQALMWNQDDDVFLKMIYQNGSKAVNYLMSWETYDHEDGLIHNHGNDQNKDAWILPTSAHLNSKWLLSLKCMINMAEKLGYSEDAEFYKEVFLKAQKSFIDTFWVKTFTHGYFKLCADKIGIYGWWYTSGDYEKPLQPQIIRDRRACTIDQIIGVWHGRLFNEDILPLDKTKEALFSIYDINRDYCHNLGWITSVMGHFPYRIDRFTASIVDCGNKINEASQWSFASSLLTHGYIEEGMTVANLTKENSLYKRGGGIYVSHSHNKNNKFGLGTNKMNVLKTWKSFKTEILLELIESGKFGDKEWARGTRYPPAFAYIPSWSFYQAASGFTPCVDGLKIKPRIGGENACYITQFAGCKVEMNVTGNGDYIDSDSVEINGEPYHVIVDGYVFIPLEKFTELDEMFIHITLS